MKSYNKKAEIKNLKIWILVAIASFLAAAAVAVFSVPGMFLSKLDSTVNHSVTGIQTPALTALFITVDIMFSFWFMAALVLVIAGIVWTKCSRVDSVSLLLSSSAAELIVIVAKAAFHRARPLNSLKEAIDYSFPSGHTAVAVVFFGMIAYLVYKEERLWVRWAVMTISLFFIAIIAFSRIYLNIHWLSDILGAVFLGISILMFSIILIKTQGKQQKHL